ncbi:MAG TPA: S8 family serine peptidase [Phycisphaerae bacterium]|nr:S8 family serine peptidase [Phycisphaerae bacterium]
MLSSVLGRLTQRLGVAISVAILSLANNPLASADDAGNQLIKIRVDAKSPQHSAIAASGKLIGSYGSFDVYEVPATSVSTAAHGVEVLEDANKILLNTGALDTTLPAVRQLQAPRGAFSGKSLHLVQFAGPIHSDWYQELQRTGVKIVSYIPNNAYLVYGDAIQVASLQASASLAPEFQWNGEFTPFYKIHPVVAARMNGPAPAENLCAIQMVEDAAANQATLQLIDQIKAHPVLNKITYLGYVNVMVDLPADKVSQIAARPEVVSIQPYVVPTLFCERQDQIVAGNLSGTGPSGPGYLAWLQNQGFDQSQFDDSGFVVDLSDSPVDNGTTSPYHFGLWDSGLIGGSSHLAYERWEGTAGTTLHGCDGHGNINAHIICGFDNSTGFPYADGAGFHYGLGVAPFVRVGSSVIFSPILDFPYGVSFTNPDYAALQSRAYNNGARVSSNSWGANGIDINGMYTTESQIYDGLVRDAQSSVLGLQGMVIVFAAGNAGSGSGTVGTPATAKNIITVGAAEGVQPFGAPDNCHLSNSDSDNADDVATFSSQGPCRDGRHKPDIVAPGTHISGGVAQAASSTFTGQADPCFNGSEVCGGSGSNFWPGGQEFYTASSGTSHSCPAVAGGCALIRQFFINHNLGIPSPAMTKAVLLNSARYMGNGNATGNLWSDAQGMGEMNLSEAFKRGADPYTVFRDQLSEDIFMTTGESRTFSWQVQDPQLPLRITIAWTDAPGSTSGAAYSNNLDLTVTAGGITYKGNSFAGSVSAPGGSADNKDNVESVFLLPGISGGVDITVTATNVNSVGIPNPNYQPMQDFAMVAYNINTCPVFTFGPSLPDAAQGQTYKLALTADNGTPPYTWSVVGGTLPPGVSLSSSGQLSGTLTSTGEYHFTAKAVDSRGCFGSHDYSVSPAVLLATFPDQGTCVNVESEPLGPEPLVITGGVPPYSYQWKVLAGPTHFTGGISTLPHPTLKPNAQTDYVLQFTALDSSQPAKSATTTMNLTVGSKANIDAGLYTRYHPIITVGDSLPFASEFSYTGGRQPATFHWSVEDDSSGAATINNPDTSDASFTASQAGTYTIVGTLLDAGGCATIYKFSVTVADNGPESKSVGDDTTTSQSGANGCGAGTGVCGQSGAAGLIGLAIGFTTLRRRRTRYRR